MGIVGDGTSIPAQANIERQFVVRLPVVLDECAEIAEIVIVQVAGVAEGGGERAGNEAVRGLIVSEKEVRHFVPRGVASP